MQKMKLMHLICLLGLLAHIHGLRIASPLGSAGNTTSDLLSSAGTIIEGLGKEALNVVPTPEELFQLAPELLIGLPEMATFGLINKLCSVYMAADTIEPRVTPDMDAMALSLRTPCNNFSFPLTHAEEMLESPYFDVNKKVALFVTGWKTNSTEDYVSDMTAAFNCRGDHNFLVLNASDAIRTLYTWSAYNTDEIGRQLALSLAKLLPQVPVENIHLIGHSLGAHVVGSTGRYFAHYTGFNISRITGLDPANPCFNEGENLYGLQRGDAEFIDVIHTNNGVFGKKHPVGDVDFYPAGLTAVQPGCIQIICSHVRAIEYFIESVYPGNEENFLGVRCTSLTNLNNGFCNGPKFPMGLAVPYNLKGNYFLSVNAKKPYGQNADENSSIGNCGRCVSK